MIKLANTICIVALLLTGANAALFGSNSNANRFAGLNEIQNIEESQFGRQLLDTIALQMKSGSPLQEIAQLLADIRTDLIKQQKEADALNTQREEQCAEDQLNFQNRISTAQSNIQEATANIAAFLADIESLTVQVDLYGRELSRLTTRETQIRDARAHDLAEYEARVVRTEDTISALEMILPRLKSLSPKTITMALSELSHIGKSNPIASFMEVASTLDEDLLIKCITKMTELLDSLKASLEEDQLAEIENEAKFNTLIFDLETLVAQTQAALDQAAGDLERATNGLANEKQLLADYQDELQSAQDGLAACITQCNLWALEYQESSEARSGEQEIVEKVQEILAQSLSGMNVYLQERVDHE